MQHSTSVDRPTPEPKSSTSNRAMIRLLYRMIEKRFQDPNFGVQELVEATQLSRSQLTRKFLDLTGFSPGKCIHRCRMYHAVYLVQQGQEPIKNIAWLCGFQTYPGFWQAIQKEYGLSPSQMSAHFKRNCAKPQVVWVIPPSESLQKSVLQLIGTVRWVEHFFRIAVSQLDNEAFELGDFAAALHLSVTQLTRNLKQTLGITPMKLLRHLRLLQAAELLLERQGSIAKISYEAGFCDQAHLSRAFKAAFGCTPLTYRRAGQKRWDLSWLRNSPALQQKM